jgi:mRNA interferase HigB
MRIISKKKLRDFWAIHASAKKPLEAWYQRVTVAVWANYQELNRDIPSADVVGDCVVFNILHNDFRLIARIRFQTHLVYVLRIMTHAEYDRTDWKTECGCFTPPPPKPPRTKLAGKKTVIPGSRRHVQSKEQRREG